MKIYLAGKVAKNDWRAEILGNIGTRYDAQDETSPESTPLATRKTWPVTRGGVLGAHDYVGPYFVEHDHGSNSRGISARDRFSAERDVVRLCLDAIERADLVFAWINDTRAYDSLWELGYARGVGTSIIIGAPSAFSPDDLWFARAAALMVFLADTASNALQAAIDFTQRFDVIIRRKCHYPTRRYTTGTYGSMPGHAR